MTSAAPPPAPDPERESKPPGRHRACSGTSRALLALAGVAGFASALPAAPPPALDSGDHWAFQPVRRPEVPGTTEGASHPVDRFLEARLEESGIAPAPSADRAVILRRLTFNLTGLPPTPAQLDAFLADESPDATAVASAVDRLLASPRYGERWGRHWLDVARYADTAGETADFPAPHAWRYRNWVIDAFNRDLPFDTFVRLQIAGDLMAAGGGDDDAPLPGGVSAADAVVATGFLAVARRFGFDILADHHLTLEDTIDTLGKAVLGLTLACARCHDHPYDPIPATDYYGLYGIFESTRFPHPGCEKNKQAYDLVPLETAAAPDAGDAPDATAIPVAYAVADGAPHDAELHVRGDPGERGPVVPRKNLELLGGQQVATTEESGRRHLAAWLTDPANPLTARVLVNRVWHHHFGRGLVATPNDFGTRGAPPSHPALLDWLTADFIDHGWSIKHLHRVITGSDAYRRVSTPVDSDRAADSERLLGHFPSRRLDAEEIRDALLFAAGELDLAPGGPHPFPPEPGWQFTQHTPFLADYEHRKRSVYLMTQRIRRHPFLALFDGPDPNASTGDRLASTVPTQALWFMNNPFVHERAAALAGRLAAEAPSDEAARLRLAARLLFAREARDAEIADALAFLADYAAAIPDGPGGDPRAAAWEAWCRVLLSSNEFLHVD